MYTDTRTSFLPLLKTSRIYFIRVANSGETTMNRTQFSADDWRMQQNCLITAIQLQKVQIGQLLLDTHVAALQLHSK